MSPTGTALSFACAYHFHRGPTACSNRRVLKMLDANAAVLQAVEAALLTPTAVEAIVQEVLAALRAPAPETTVPRRTALLAELPAIEAEIARCTAAVGQAPDLGSLLDALRQKEAQRSRLQHELARLTARVTTPCPDAATLTRLVRGHAGHHRSGRLKVNVDKGDVVGRRHRSLSFYLEGQRGRRRGGRPKGEAGAPKKRGRPRKASA